MYPTNHVQITFNLYLYKASVQQLLVIILWALKPSFSWLKQLVIIYGHYNLVLVKTSSDEMVCIHKVESENYERRLLIYSCTIGEYS